MTDREWQEFVSALVNAKRSLAQALGVLEELEGPAAGVEQSLSAALAAIDTIYAIETADDAASELAIPTEVQDFWATHGQLPGFSLRH